MTIQVETNVAAAYVSKGVILESKFLFIKDIPLFLNYLVLEYVLTSCRKLITLQKQQVVEVISQSKNFTYCTDATSPQKLHYMEHHAFLDNGSTLSIGFTTVPDDKSNTLLEKSTET